jgi:hypothetical protein
MIPSFKVEKDDGSAYVPDMSHHYHIDINGETTVKFTDSSVDEAVLLAATTTAAATDYTVDVDVVEAFGRTLLLTSTDADGVVVIKGTDFLGQQMSQQVTFSTGAGATTKAFKHIHTISSSTNVGDVVIKAGTGYGLPFCAVELVREVVDGLASTEGALTAAVSTTPSVTTGDVRGTFNPNTAGDSAKDIMVTYVTTADLTGGLYGQPQV